MSTMYGADVAELRALAAKFDQVATQLDGSRHAVSNAIQISVWVGPFASTFRIRWDSELSLKVRDAGQLLSEAAHHLRVNADQQDRASAATDPDPGLYEHSGKYVRAPGVTLTDRDLKANQIYQGEIGDCWFLAPLAGVVERDPDFIRRHMHQNSDGSWSVKMYGEDGNPIIYTVAAAVAEKGASGPGGAPNWVSIYEKAAAEHFGDSYEDIDGGSPERAFRAILGGSSTVLKEPSLPEIRDLLANGPVVLASEQNEKPGGFLWFGPADTEDTVADSRVVPSHAYMVDRVEKINGEWKIHVLNPWGPDGGSGGKVGDLWLNEKEYRESFSNAYTARMDGEM